MSADEAAPTKQDEDLYPEEEEVSEGDWMRPQVDVKEVQVITGEEDEDVFWQHRAKLYRWAKEKTSWQERGLGDAKLLKHRATSKVRFLLRQEKTLKIVANHYVYKAGTLCNLQSHPCSDKIFIWTVIDYSDDEPKLQQFALKFGQVEYATEFKSKFEQAVEINAEAIKPTKKNDTITSPKDEEDSAKQTSDAEEKTDSDKPQDSEKKLQ